MQPRRIVSVVIASGGLGLGCLSLLVGCGDDTRTTGTQVQVSPGDRAISEQLSGTMKEEQAARKREAAENRKTQGK